MGDLPTLLVFDVNETLSGTEALAGTFAEVAAPDHLAAIWVRTDFAGRVRAVLHR